MDLLDFHCSDDVCEAVDCLVKIFEVSSIVCEDIDLSLIAVEERLQVICLAVEAAMEKIVEEFEGHLFIAREGTDIWIGCDSCEYGVKLNVGEAYSLFEE